MSRLFVPGIELCRRFYFDAVRPVLDCDFPGLKHAAALIGPGSEVLGFDTPMSTDHHWGPRVLLFLTEADGPRYRDIIFEHFRWHLPHEFLGYPTNFAQPVAEDQGTRLLRPTTSGPIDHRVEIYTARQFVIEYLGFDVAGELHAADWLSFPQQKLRTLIGGAVYHDEVGLQTIRDRFSWYPHDIWLYMLASGWSRIGQEEHLMGRAGFVGDELGSAIIAGRLARDAVNLSFLMAKEYAPYAKWLGSAFMRLPAGADIGPALLRVLRSETWFERGEHLAAVYTKLVECHDALGLTPTLPTLTTSFWGRPFPVIWGGRIADALVAAISDPGVRRIAERSLIGNIDQISDNTNVVENTPRDLLRSLFL